MRGVCRFWLLCTFCIILLTAVSWQFLAYKPYKHIQAPSLPLLQSACMTDLGLFPVSAFQCPRWRTWKRQRTAPNWTLCRNCRTGWTPMSAPGGSSASRRAGRADLEKPVVTLPFWLEGRNPSAMTCDGLLRHLLTRQNSIEV